MKHSEVCLAQLYASKGNHTARYPCIERSLFYGVPYYRIAREAFSLLSANSGRCSFYWRGFLGVLTFEIPLQQGGLLPLLYIFMSVCGFHSIRMQTCIIDI